MNTLNTPQNTGNRLVSLDVFRGVTIAVMILVNNQGDWSCVYPALAHAPWHGLLGADFVFPFFLFAMGVSLAFALGAQVDAGIPRKRMVLPVLRRSAVLVLLGLVLNLFPSFDFSAVRIPGVLQRIGLCYCCASLLFLYTGRRTRGIVTISLLVLYGALLLFVTPDGSGRGSLEPCCSLPGYIDAMLFRGHTFEHAPAPGFDPEGLLSTLPAVASAMIGALAAPWMRSGPRWRLPAAGVLMAAAGAALSPAMPFNKSLWTPTYVLITGGAALVLIWLCGLLFDGGRRGRAAAPFLVLGRNAIAVYLLSSMAGKAMVSFFFEAGGERYTLKSFLFQSLFAPFAPPCAASALYAAAFLLAWTAIMYLPYRKRIFIRV